ncbi:uncharacterized protein LOC127085460 isoform X2 [Lathyrus oleraceus]|nr:uncharacterized protein LOC127085460 isoform X2 [Pisum sativum]XP_050881933.1 uncharacterized protein LOC127085460 isoform X2 [Pisum sativum]
MDQVQTELAEMRANMAQFMTMMQGVVQGQEELRALAQRLEAVIPPVHRAPPVDVPVHENAAVTILVNDYAVGDELKGIRISEQPLAAETVNVRATRAPVRHPGFSSSSGSKKTFSGAPKRGESETNVVHRRRSANRGQFRQAAVVTIPATQPQQQQRRPVQQYQHQQPRPQQQVYQPHNGNQASTSNERKKITFDPIPMSYAELYPSLLERNLITPREPPPIPVNPRWWYRPEQHCVYHSGAPGHDVDSCFQLKMKVQDLVRSGILILEDLGPNANQA